MPIARTGSGSRRAAAEAAGGAAGGPGAAAASDRSSRSCRTSDAGRSQVGQFRTEDRPDPVVDRLIAGHAEWLEDIARPFQIGRASCRERVCQYVSISVVAGTLKKKITEPSRVS